MTDKYNALVVSLERDIREDDAEFIINAIKMIKGVNGVTGNVVDGDTYSNQLRIARLMTDKLHDLITDLNKI